MVYSSKNRHNGYKIIMRKGSYMKMQKKGLYACI